MPHDTKEHAATREDVEAAYPEFCQLIAAAAVAEERTRIRRILALAPMGQRALAFALAFAEDEACSPSEAALRLLDAETTKGGRAPFERAH
jgi:hypothetical protein